MPHVRPAARTRGSTHTGPQPGTRCTSLVTAWRGSRPGLPECQPWTFTLVFAGKGATAHLSVKKPGPWEELFSQTPGPPRTGPCDPGQGPTHQLRGWGCCDSSWGRQGLAVSVLYQEKSLGRLISQLRTFSQRSRLGKLGQDGHGWEWGRRGRWPQLGWGTGISGAPRLPILNRGVSKVRNARDKVCPSSSCPGREVEG